MPAHTHRIRTFLWVACLAFTAAGLAAPTPVVSYKKQADGLLLAVSPGVMKLQVWADGIVRVIYSSTDSLPTRPSMAVVGSPRTTAWSLTESARDLTLSTKLLRAVVNRATGAVTFRDASGAVLLQEEPAGKQMTPEQVGGEEAFHAEDRFILPPGEALYGLGQHANGLMDYRGNPITLRQVNMDVGVPVMLSSRGYGIFWDNPSQTTASCGGEAPKTIPPDHLFASDGKPGLTGEYFSTREFTTPASTRTDPQVDFNWPAAPAPGVGHDNFCARWTGFVETGAAGDYDFITQGDDGVRLWVDGKLVIDDWNVHPLKTMHAHLALAAHTRHPIRLEFFQQQGEAIVRLCWVPPGVKTSATNVWASDVADAIDYYFLYGPKADQVISHYRDLTGQAPMPPRWALGYFQCKERYQSQAELLGVVDEYRRRGHPLDGIIQDWFYWAPAPWGSHKFDPARYPDPAAMVREVHEKHAHMMISVWAKFAPGSDNYDELKSKGFLLSNGGGEPYYDAFNPEARAVYWRQMKDELFSLGIDAWWLDASEPECWQGLPLSTLADIKTAASAAERVVNAYPLMHTTSVYQGQRAATSDKRVFILTRSAWAGQQRNGATTWSGDIYGSWDVLKQQIPAGLNFCLSGIPYWNTDIGGFISSDPATPAYRELFVRWFQFGAFCPMFRVHGTGFPKEMWRFGPEAEAILDKYDNLRYRLLPYTYSLAWRVTSQGYTMMRGLMMDFRADPKALQVGDQFLWGQALMVCPVTDPGATSRKVYLPAGTQWTDFWTGRALKGGQTVHADAPLDTMPIFVRAGSIVPMGPIVQYAEEKPADPIELLVYPGASGNFTLYEDEGDGYGYEEGAYATIPIEWNEARKALTIGACRGNFPGRLKERTFRIVWVRPGQGVGPDPVEKPDAIVTYRGAPVVLTSKNRAGR